MKFNTDATLPTTSPLDLSDVTLVTVKDYKKTTTTFSSDDKVTMGETALLLESETIIRYYISDLNGLSAEGMTLSYTSVNGTTGTAEVKYSEEKGMYYAEITNIGATQLSDMFTAYFVSNGAQVSDAVTFGAYSHVFSTLRTGTNENDINLAKALYKYGVAATDYIG